MIQFPKLHIAESVLNRISNTLEETGPLGLSTKAPAAPVIQKTPEVPNPTVIGSEIDRAVRTPMQAAGVPPEKEADANSGMLEASVMGGSPFDGALVGASM